MALVSALARNLDEHASLFPALYSVVRVRHVKELNREHTVKVTGLDKEGIQIQYLKESTRTKRQWERECDDPAVPAPFGGTAWQPIRVHGLTSSQRS